MSNTAMTLEEINRRVANLRNASIEDRVEWIQEDRWIGYDRAKSIVKEIEDLINHPRNLRMPCRILIGEPNNGKTMILNRCADLHSKYEDPSGECLVSTLIFECPPEPDEGRLYSQILKSLLVAHREDAPAERLLAKVIDKCTELGIRTILADEFHNMNNGRAADQRQYLAALKSLINVLGVSFVAAGTADTVRALMTDPQFVTRFEKLALHKWGVDATTRNLVSTIERRLPLDEKSGLATDPQLLKIILVEGRETIGGIVGLIRRAAISAVTAGEPRITEKILRAAANEIQDRRLAAAV